MASAVGIAMYSGINNYPSQSTTVTVEQEQQISQLPEEQYISTFFCRALYDYQTQDPSSLSFHKNEIIEVLTRLESGWWDGLLGDERGWFPSNYVTMISDEEAEIALSNHDPSIQQALQQINGVTHDTHSNDFHSRTQIHHLSDSQWSGNRHDISVPSNGSLGSRNAGATSSSDFWMPRVTQDGQIYYLNTHTGQHSRDLPIEVDDVSVGELAGLASSPPSSRSGTGAGLGLSALAEPSIAGFGIPKRSGTPEPWMRRLADDGLSYHYWNKLNGQTSWTIPEAEGAVKIGRNRALTGSSTASSDLFSSPDEDLAPTRLRSDSATSQTQRGQDRNHSKLEHVSDSEDSGLYSPDHGDSPSASGRSHNDQDLSGDEVVDRKPSVELTVAEKIAQSLQQSLAPPPPDLISDLSHIAHNAIAAVVQKNQSLVGISRRTEHDQLDNLIRVVVTTVRNLLYISAPPGHIPNSLIPRDARGRRETTASQTLLKPAQRKVTATLSKLVLSARAMEYDSGPAAHETAFRIESDAEELDHAILTFVAEVQRCQNEQLGGVGAKRVQGCFSAIYLGLGLVGAGCAGSWKGFGWVPLDDSDEAPQRILDGVVFSEFKMHMVSMQTRFGTFHGALKSIGDDCQRVWGAGRELLSGLSSLLLFVANIHIARHVDIDGFYSDTADAEHAPLYKQTVERARLLARTLEAVVQALYDDAATLLLAMQRVRYLTRRASRQDRDLQCEYIDAISTSLKSNLQFLMQTLDALVSLGHDQAEMAQTDYTSAIELRMSRLSIIDNRFDARPMSLVDPADPESEDIVDIEVAFGVSGMKKTGGILSDRAPMFRSQSQLSDTTLSDRSHMTATSNYDRTMSALTLVPSSSERSPDVMSVSDSISLLDDEATATRVATNAKKIKKIFGDDAPEHIISTKPWYLRPDYTKNDMTIDVDGSVRAGTVPALVERLTSHDPSDPTFLKTFLMTYKSFTNLDELFDHLVRRFFISTPDGLSPTEAEEWRRLKQHIIQMRVLNTFRAMVMDEDFFEKEDLYILDRMKEFLQNEKVSKISAAKQLLSLVERARGGDLKKGLTPNFGSPPTSIMPKAPKPNKKLKLLDIDPLELARQMTIMESHLYQRIRPVECLQRSREQKTDYNDNIARVIQTSNRIANWVADSVLSHEDSKNRATILKQFISVADRCRSMHNYSSMVAIVSGLNSPPIRRLKRSWEQVNTRYMALLGACEMTIDAGKNFNNYRSTLAKISPPCVPFIGVFLTTLTFIQDGSKDTLPGNLVNFRKRQKASEVIQNIQRWQTFPHNFNPISSVQTYLEESLAKFNEHVDIGDYFWNLSLEREPREREDEKMARLLQESGFL